MTNTELLCKKMEDSGYKRSYIAKQLGLSSAGLRNKVKNKYEFRTSEITGLCHLLCIESLEEKERIFFDS